MEDFVGRIFESELVLLKKVRANVRIRAQAETFSGLGKRRGLRKAKPAH